MTDILAGIDSLLTDLAHQLNDVERRPQLRFWYVYLWQRGFLDGAEGYYFARLHGFYEFLCVAKTREMKKRAEIST